MKHLPPHMHIWIAFLHLERAYKTLRPSLSVYERRTCLHILRLIMSMFWSRVSGWFRAKWVDKNGRRVQTFDLNERERKMVDDMT